MKLWLIWENASGGEIARVPSEDSTSNKDLIEMIGSIELHAGDVIRVVEDAGGRRRWEGNR